MKARHLALAGTLALFALVLAWQLQFAPPERVPVWLAASLHAAPLAPALLLMLLGRRSAAFFGALAALILFSHGVSELWSSPSVRGLAIAEVVLSVAVVIAASWDGMRARFAKRRSA